MLSVLIVTGDRDEERLAHTLASLVPAVVEGLLREVIVVAPESAAEAIAVAEHAGCALAASIPAAIAAARAEWLLFLEAGARLRDGWGESVLVHVAKRGGAARLTADAPLLRRLIARFGHRHGPFRFGLLFGRREAAQAFGDKGLRHHLPRLHTLAARISLPV